MDKKPPQKEQKPEDWDNLSELWKTDSQTSGTQITNKPADYASLIKMRSSKDRKSFAIDLFIGFVILLAAASSFGDFFPFFPSEIVPQYLTIGFNGERVESNELRGFYWSFFIIHGLFIIGGLLIPIISYRIRKKSKLNLLDTTQQAIELAGHHFDAKLKLLKLSQTVAIVFCLLLVMTISLSKLFAFNPNSTTSFYHLFILFGFTFILPAAIYLTASWQIKKTNKEKSNFNHLVNH